MVETVINQNDGFVQITAVGGELDLDGDFPIYEKSHVQIIRERGGVETTLVLNTDYTIADNQLEVTAGFTAVLAGSATPAVAGDIYTLLQNVPESRTTDFSQAGDFKAATVNREFDLQTQMVQQLRRDVDKSARLPDTSALTSLTLPEPDAGKVLAWNDDEDGLENVTPNDEAFLSVSPYIETTVLPAASEAALKAAINLEIGTDVQAYDADLATLASAFTTASASEQASLKFAEDTDNGSNYVRLIAPASIASNVDITLPGVASTLATLAGTETFTNKTITNPNIIGTTTNDNAAAGSVGEVIEAEVLSGSAISLTTATTADITSISLTAGDWDVTGMVATLAAGGTVVTQVVGSVHTTSATLPTIPNKGAYARWVGSSTGAGPHLPVGMRRFSVSGTTTVYLVMQATFTTSTLTGYGFIWARRVR